MKSHEKTQKEANEHEDQEEDTDVLVAPTRFVIRKFIAGHRISYSQLFLRTASAVQPIGRASQGQEIPKFRNHHEWRGRGSYGFSNLVDEHRRSVP
jgi:hypothetical protein